MTLELNGHTIKKSEIVGIGPLIEKYDPNYDPSPEANQKAQKRRLQYRVHLRNRSILVKSPWYEILAQGDKKTDKVKVEYFKWSAGYKRAKQLVIDIINSDLP